VRPTNGQRYEPRRPERTLLYRLVSEHLETFLEHAHDSHARGLPKYVEQELRRYLRCGIYYALAVIMRGLVRQVVRFGVRDAGGSA